MADQFNILDRSVLAAANYILPIRQVTDQRFFVHGGSTSTSAALGNGSLRVAPFVLPNDVTLSHVGAEITVAGEAGSTLRLGIFESNASGNYPGALLIQAAADLDGTVVAVQEVVCAVTLRGSRLYWVGGVVQNAPTTQPTARTLGASGIIPGIVSTSVPATNSTNLGYLQGSVSAALPATFSASINPAGVAPRVHFRLA